MTPVPPLATASVPPSVRVPDVVIAPPVRVSPVLPPDPETEVTVPVFDVKPDGLLAAYAPSEVKAPPAVVAPVPPLATGSVPATCVDRLTPESAPPRVRLPAVVTVPLSVIPLTVPVPPTDVTVPPLEVDAIVTPPALFVTDMPEPAVIAATLYPVPLPIRS